MKSLQIEGEIEEALTRRFHRRIPVVGAGRTDAGVHARGQAIHFDLLSEEIPFTPPPVPDVPPPPAMASTSSTDAMSSAAEIVSTATITEEEQERCNKFCNELQNSMNRMLPLDIRIFRLQLAPFTWTTERLTTEEAENDENVDEIGSEYEYDSNTQQQPLSQSTRPRPWHAIQSAHSKWYSYRFTLGPTLWNPMDRFTRTHFVHRPFMPGPLSPSSSSLQQSASSPNKIASKPYALTTEDMQRLQSILQLYEGTHDFSAFGGQLEQNQKRVGRIIDTVRTVYRVELVKEPLMEDYRFGSSNFSHGNERIGDEAVLQQPVGFIGEEGNYRIDFLLQGALYKMVRNMVGAAIEVWLGRMEEERLVELLQIPQQKENGETRYFRSNTNLEEERHQQKRRKMGRKDNPCKPAPPEGLTLECVYYDDGF